MKKVIFAPGEFYHLYNRGIDKHIIFPEKIDFFRFLILLYVANDNKNFKLSNLIKDLKDKGFLWVIEYTGEREPLVDIGAYCLMDNHFHLLVCERVEGGISKFMERLLKAYVQYFNHKYERKGALFEGNFKAKHVDNDNYLKYLHSYIHLNPVKFFETNWKEEGIKNLNGAENFLRNYIFSSFIDFLNIERPESAILNRISFPDYFEEPHSFEEFIQEWLTYGQDFSTIA